MSIKAIWTDETCEYDPRWTAVDAYTISHLHPPSRPNNAALSYALENMRKHGMQNHATYPAYGKFLALQCQMGNVKHALEVGTLGAFTCIWMATLNPEIRITTLDNNLKHVEVARQNLEFAGVTDRVNIIMGSALDSLSALKVEIERGDRPKFDFVFIDADKENNGVYFDRAVELTRSGGAIFVDDVVYKGHVVDEEMQENSFVKGATRVIEGAGKDERVEAVVMQIVGEKNYDGFLMAVVK